VNGETTVGVTALLAAEQYDEGDVLAQAAIDIEYPITISTAIERMTEPYVRVATDVVQRIINGDPLVGKAQDHTKPTYSLWRDESDYRIDWSNSATQIRRTVDAVGHPYRGASSMAAGRMVRVLGVEERPDVTVMNRTPGKVLFVENGLPIVV